MILQCSRLALGLVGAVENAPGLLHWDTPEIAERKGWHRRCSLLLHSRKQRACPDVVTGLSDPRRSTSRRKGIESALNGGSTNLGEAATSD